MVSKVDAADGVTTLTDLRLAANQVRGEFEARDKRMENYLKAVQTLVKPFNSFTIKKIPRSENRRAETLSKLTSMCFGHLSKEVMVKVLKERSI